MTARQEAFVRAYEYLRSVGAAHTQKDIAAKMEASVSNISSALNGVATVLTDRFLKRFNRAYDDIFNMDWLLYGEGEMLRCPAATVQQHNVHGDNNAAHTITSGDTATDKLLNIVTQSQHLATTAQEQTTKAQQHIDRLLAIIERLSDGQKMQMP